MTIESIVRSTENVKENHSISSLESEGGIAKCLATEILLDSNELASDILATNGFVLLNEEGFAKYNDVWQFYGVSERYFAGVLQRNRISSREMPDDVQKGYRGNIMISARMVLALSAVMYAGRNIPDCSKAMQVYQNLQGTRYRYRAERKAKMAIESFEDIKKRSAVPDTEDKSLCDESEMVEILPDGRMVISLSGLFKLFGCMTEGKTRNNRGRKGIAVTATKDGVTIKFDSMTECARYIGTTPGTISTYACAPHRRIHGYKISYAE